MSYDPIAEMMAVQQATASPAQKALRALRLAKRAPRHRAEPAPRVRPTAPKATGVRS